MPAQASRSFTDWAQPLSTDFVTVHQWTDRRLISDAPALAKLADGRLLCSVQLWSRDDTARRLYGSDRCLVFASDDRGASWREIARIPFPKGDLSEKKHYFNHLLVNPDGSRFEFLHRWSPRGKHDCRTRMLTAAMDGSDRRVVDHSGCTSHFIWRDPRHILAWSWYASRRGGFCLFEDKAAGKVEVIGGEVMYRDGHVTYLPGNEWIVNDSYPDKNRLQTVFLYHVATSKIVLLGRFRSPPEYTGEWRVDTHPRHSPDGRSIVIDSPHTGEGRQMHLIDVSRIVG